MAFNLSKRIDDVARFIALIEENAPHNVYAVLHNPVAEKLDVVFSCADHDTNVEALRSVREAAELVNLASDEWQWRQREPYRWSKEQIFVMWER